LPGRESFILIFKFFSRIFSRSHFDKSEASFTDIHSFSPLHNTEPGIIGAYLEYSISVNTILRFLCFVFLVVSVFIEKQLKKSTPEEDKICCITSLSSVKLEEAIPSGVGKLFGAIAITFSF
jgi:hypothetical protein